VTRDAYGDSLEHLARMLRLRFGPDPSRHFVRLAAEIPAANCNDQETQRIPVTLLPAPR
jgi:hypothetical protein